MNNKFQVGQSVYWIYEKDNKHYIHDDMFMIQCVSLDELGHHYSLVDSNEDIIDWCREKDLFSFIEDAEKELIVREISRSCENLIGTSFDDKEREEKAQDIILKSFKKVGLEW